MSQTGQAPGQAPGLDAAYLEALHAQWKDDPASVDASWQYFFQGFELASDDRDCESSDQARAQSRVASLIYAYRSLGHRVACTNPLQSCMGETADLSLEKFDLGDDDLDRVFDTGHLAGPQRATLRQILETLQQTYCGHIGVEYLHIEEMDVRRWLQGQMEPIRNQPSLSHQQKLDVLQQLMDAEMLETFIHRHYLGQKRFSLEGSETLIPLLHALVEQAPEEGVEEIVMGMSHRGRLNVLANLLDKSYATIFSEFEDNYIEGAVGGDGDVKYHKGASSDHVNRLGQTVHVSLNDNPSHLEAVDPVVLGRARAKQRRGGDTEKRRKVLPLLVHGDAAFAGQGIVAETFNMSRLAGYKVGGTVHVVVNNQIGFTTSPDEARSTPNATDVAKMVGAPVFHVNGDDPEAAVHVALLALRYRQEFGRDVVIELVAYRRHGHSEGDEPAFTQPRMYSQIKQQVTARKQYEQKLLASGDLTEQQADELASRFEQHLEEAYGQAKAGGVEPTPHHDDALAWAGYLSPYSGATVDTAVSHEALVTVARGITTVPEGFNLNPKVARQQPRRMEAVEGRGTVDWALAESLAMGTLLVEGTPVRLSGQDSERGTFSQRHAVWRDTATAERYMPLNHIDEDQARLCVYNSPLAEASVLGFDYGYSLAEPRMLILWEAQFGDFANGAQVIIDQFISAAQSKWQRSSGLVMLLPHGYEGQGPEHSNAYLERYLAAGAQDNIQVAYPSTPAQYFHILRRQQLRPFRRPLILMTPKSLLRLPAAASPLAELTDGGFEEVLDDPRATAEVRRLVLSSGKVYYDLDRARQEAGRQDVALVRLEQLYPFPETRVRQVLAQYAEAEVVWAQEEPQNRGGYTFVYPRLSRLAGDRPVRYAGRRASASPATGSLRRHRKQQQDLVTAALDGEADTPQAQEGAHAG